MLLHANNNLQLLVNASQGHGLLDAGAGCLVHVTVFCGSSSL